MKAYVIKSKNDEKYATYATAEQKYWTEYLWQAKIYYSYNDVMRELAFRPYKDCEPVEITIAEGNFEQENKQLKEQLSEKNKEIEELKRYKKGAYEKYVSKCAYLQQQIKDTFKQVCDEIKKVVEFNSEWYEQGYVINMVTEDLLKEIDKIEQAKVE